MKDLIEYMAKSLVDKPEQVQVIQMRGAQTLIFKLVVAPEDKGWVIGRHGRVANAMRTLLRVAALVRGGRQATLEIA